MTVIEAIKGRFSVRKYKSEPVNSLDLATILEAARLSQSAKNFQDWRFIVVKDESMKKNLCQPQKIRVLLVKHPL